MNTDDLPLILAALEGSPSILRNLLQSAPPDRLQLRRIPGKWSIHEHVCHLTSVHPVMFERLKLFQAQESPLIEPSEGLLPPASIEAALDQFAKDRSEFVTLGRNLSPEVLAREARHPEYDLYTPYHMFRHILMHDHLHMYRIEELALTSDALLRKG